MVVVSRRPLTPVFAVSNIRVRRGMSINSTDSRLSGASEGLAGNFIGIEFDCRGAGGPLVKDSFESPKLGYGIPN